MRPWENLLKERLDRAGWELHAEDWEQLQARYAGVKRRRTLRNWALGAVPVALAAGLALVFFLKKPEPVDLLHDRPEQPLLAQVTVPETPAAVTKPPLESPAPVPARHLPSAVGARPGSSSSTVVSAPAASQDPATDPDRVTPASSGPDPGQEEEAPAAADAPAPSAPAAPERTLSARDWEETVPTLVRTRRRVSLSTGGTLAHLERSGIQTGQQLYADVRSRVNNVGGDAPLTYGSQLQRIAVFTQAGDQKVGEIHHRPIELGLTAGIPLGRRWTVVSGIEYACYPSSFSYSVSGTKRQEAHYLGIPLRLDYYLIDRDRLHVYLGAGVLADRGILARQDGERLPADGFGCSLLGTGGLQWDFSRFLGLYLEPRYSLFLSDPEGRLVTFRTESPACFSLAAGLRINL